MFSIALIELYTNSRCLHLRSEAYTQTHSVYSFTSSNIRTQQSSEPPSPPPPLSRSSRALTSSKGNSFAAPARSLFCAKLYCVVRTFPYIPSMLVDPPSRTGIYAYICIRIQPLSRSLINVLNFYVTRFTF